MRRNLIKYVVAAVCSVILSSGPACMAFVHANEEIGTGILWLTLLFSLMTFTEIMLAMLVFLPKLFEKGRYILFAICVWASSYCVNAGSVWVEHALRNVIKGTHILENPLGLATFLEGIPASTVGVFLVCGIVLWQLYDDLRKEYRKEGEMTRLLELRVREFRTSINMDEVRRLLQGAVAEARVDASKANIRIRELSEYLRARLYDTDGKYRSAGYNIAPVSIEWNKATEFIVEPRYRKWRHLCLVLVVFAMGGGFLFEYPDQLRIEPANIVFAVVFSIVLTVLIYLNIYVVFGYFQKRGKVGWYLATILGVMGVISVCMYMMAHSHGPIYNDNGLLIPNYILILSVVGNMLTFFFIFVGSASMMLIKRNVEGRWRVSKIEAETVRIEFETLQKQVNPHFLFNVLNNAGFLTYEDPEEAISILEGLEFFLEYMIKETGKETTRVFEEKAFLDNYILLEKSSGKELAYISRMTEEAGREKIPPMLLLPIVENAVKHSGRRKDIRVDITAGGGRLCFVCRNNCDDGEVRLDRRRGGLGLENTRRRLEILYGDEFKMSARREGGEFIVELLIPEFK